MILRCFFVNHPHMKSNHLSLIRAIPVLLGLGLMAVYLATMAPGLTWANHGADGGDLITAAATGGIAHPTGYPLYLIFARLFQLLPIGSLAYRTNLFSAVAMSAASVLIYSLVKRQLDSHRASNGWLTGIISGSAFGLSPLAWSQAVITEVYALNAFFVALVLFISTGKTPEPWHKRQDVILGLLLGLGLGVHITIIFLVPAVFLVRLFVLRTYTASTIEEKKHFWKYWQIDVGSVSRIFLGTIIGLTPYLLIPLWASTHPPVDWGNPTTWQREWWLVSGQLYQTNLFSLSFADVGNRIRLWAGLLIGQFGFVGLGIGLVGLMLFLGPSRLMFLSIWEALIFSAFAIDYNTSDWYVYLIPTLISVSIWIGFGINSVMNLVRVERRWTKRLMAFGLLSYFLFLPLGHWSQVDASHDLRAENFGQEVLANAPPNALIFVQGDQAVFALWYFHLALHERPDLVVVATDLLSFDWYQENIRSIYPQLVLPEYFPWPIVMELSNPGRAICSVQYSGQTELQCSTRKKSVSTVTSYKTDLGSGAASESFLSQNRGIPR